MAERSLLAAVSGVDANQTWLDEIGSNIANADTVGYKSQNVEFQDLLNEQISGAQAPPTGGGGAGANPIAVGSGTQVGAVATDLNEGSLDQTGKPTDVAIQGAGYFVVDGGGQQLYTRDGSFTLDANGDLATQNGLLVMGWQANSAGVINTNTPLTGITVPTGQNLGATPTTNMTLAGNLPAWNGIGAVPIVANTLNCYDALGNVVPVTLTFTGVAGQANQWTVQGTVPNPSGGTDTLWTTAPTVAFNPSTGQLASVSGATTNANGSLSLPVSTMPAGYNFPAADTWSVTFPAPNTAESVTQYAGQQSIALIGQDGYAAGSLEGFTIGGDGIISGSFSNGRTLQLGQLALASFSNPSGLADQGGGAYDATVNSGQPLVGTAGTGGRGSLVAGALEMSNVDLGNELTNLIQAQEAYQANTKVITTTQQAIQALESIP